MSLLPDRGLLAIAAVIDVAVNARAAPLSARALAERHNLLPRHFEALLQELVRADILKGHRGPRGGYELARERRRISVGDIVRATAGDATTHKLKPRPRVVERVVEPALAAAQAAFFASLDAITVDQLCRMGGSMAEAELGDVDFII